jgi:lipoate-protein ligase A
MVIAQHLGHTGVMRVLRSSSDSVHANLAWEEWLLDRFETEGPVLFFYVNRPAVVLGKNQNIWRESDTAAARRDGVTLARRISGGGTVYHDEGNLNYSLILSRHAYGLEGVFRQLTAALLGIGIKADRMEGHGLGVAGRKFSGSAFCYRGSAVLHHGTLLIRANLDHLRRYLKPVLSDIETRAIASRPASVVNLSELMPDLSMELLQAVLARTFAGRDQVEIHEPPLADPTWRVVMDRHREWDWTYGYTPGFQWTLAGRNIALDMRVEKGRVCAAVLRPPELRPVPELTGCIFSSSALAERLACLPFAGPLTQQLDQIMF